MEKTILLRPRLSEKTYGLGTTKRVYVFDVPGDATKPMIAAAVAAQFEVTPTNVNMANVKGKPKRSVRKGGRAINGQRSDFKKAFVTLKDGQKLPFFDEPETDKKADKKSAKKETK